MYTAICIMLAGMLAGRLLRRFISRRLLGGCIFGAILMLLFLLGVSIGSNAPLLEKLPVLGWQSLILVFFSLVGSICASILVSRIYWARGFGIKGRGDSQERENG